MGGPMTVERVIARNGITNESAKDDIRRLAADSAATALREAEAREARLREAATSALAGIGAVDVDELDALSLVMEISRQLDILRAALASTEEPGFRIRFICCGHDDGSAVRRTWQEADELRQSYISVQGHDRTAIIETLASTEEPRHAD